MTDLHALLEGKPEQALVAVPVPQLREVLETQGRLKDALAAALNLAGDLNADAIAYLQEAGVKPANPLAGNWRSQLLERHHLDPQDPALKDYRKP